MTIQVRAQLNGGAQQTGAVTVADGDVVQLSLASAAGLGPLLWEIYSHPTDEAGAGYALPLPSGWTDGPDGHSYFYEGTTPPTFTIPSAPYWGKILVRCTPGGDALAADTSLVLTMLSPLGLEDVAPLETIQADAYRTWMRAFQNDLRLLGAGSAGTPYASTPAAVASSGKSGASGDYARGDHVHAGVASVAATGKAGITGAATLSAGKGVTLTQVSSDIEIAASGTSGPVAALVWDTTQATDSTKGRYATMAEIVTAIGTAESPVEVEVVGTALANSAGTYEWRNVHFWTTTEGTTLTGSEGVVIRNARFSGPLAITSAATSTRFLTYTAGVTGYFDGVTLTGSGTKGLITTNNAGAQKFVLRDTTLAANAYEQTVAAAAEFRTDGVTYSGTDQFLGSAGSLAFVTTNRTVGSPDLTSWSGAQPTYNFESYAGASAPPIDASTQVHFPLDNAPGATSLTNAGVGTAIVLGTLTGTTASGVATPIGDGIYFQGVANYQGVGTAKTYAPTTTDFTISCFVRMLKSPVGGGAATKASFFGKPTAAGATAALFVKLDTGQVMLWIDTSSGTASVATGELDTQWTHLAATYDGANVKLYINGILVQTTAHTGTLTWDNTYSWVVGNIADTTYFLLRECRFEDVVRTGDELKLQYEKGAFGSAGPTLVASNAEKIQGVDVNATAPADYATLTYDAGAAEWKPSTPIARAVKASLTWTATAGVYTIVSSYNVDTIGAYDYGSGTDSLQVILLDTVTNGIGHATADPDWVSAFHIDPAGPVMISAAEVRVDFRNKADTQISPDDGAGTLTVFGDL